MRSRLAAHQNTARAAARRLLEEAASADNDARRKRSENPAVPEVI